jgi:type II restriction/modification system DNA methylase subunit YeeA
MTPLAFIRKWKASNLKERSAAQEHFIDLCRLLGEPTPAEADPLGDWYCFERGASKLSGSDGWADVWKRGHFSWEYKGKHKDLQAAYRQLQQYSVALENPPLLVVCDMERFRLYTNWTNTVQHIYDFTLDDLHEPEQRQLLKWVFNDSERLKPGKTRQMLTEEAAEQFASLAQRLRTRGHDPQAVAHFINRLVFCMFAEDIGLLPNTMFSRMLEEAGKHPAEFVELAQDLFRAMRSGGRVGLDHIEWFNGGLFDTDEVLPLNQQDTALVLNVARLDWSDIDPSIFGTLFERGLDPDKRGQLGAHYTDRDKIMLLVEPVVIRPLQAEWEDVRTQIAQWIERFQKGRSAQARSRAYNTAQALHDRFLDNLKRVRLFDPACGSGNFLYLALLALKDLEYKAILDAEAMGLERQFPVIGPECLKGIEVNPYAAELARVSIWIGEIQWMRRNGFELERQPILRPLEAIECRDAVLNPDGTEAAWPEVDFIVGNPPFLGSRKLQPELGPDYVKQLRRVYQNRVPTGADLVCYWFEKARYALAERKVRRVGLVATTSIRRGASRKVLEQIQEQADIYEAWENEPWVVEGAAVRVSLICFTRQEEAIRLPHRLNGTTVGTIYSDLSAPNEGHEYNLGFARKLQENKAVSFQGIVPRSEVKLAVKKKLGLPDATFVLSGSRAREILTQPTNPNGRPNTDVILPYIIGDDITTRPMDHFIVDFQDMDEKSAALYEAPYCYIQSVKLHRAAMTQPEALETWWRHWRSRHDMRQALSRLSRVIVTPRVSKYRLFIWKPPGVLPDTRLVVIARDDDTTFGILHSWFHELWSLRLGGWHGAGNDPQYTPSTGLETFPFPKGLTPNIPAEQYADDPRAQKIAASAKRLDKLRNHWLNPPNLVVRVPEVVEGYPDRILPKDEAAAQVLKTRTLTNLYNEWPAWLNNAHRALDEAVAEAYGWLPNMSEDEILTKLLALNLARAR